MNLDEIKGKWGQLTGAAREKWGKLTEDEVAQAEGNRDKLVGLIQEKYGKAKSEAEKEVDEFLARF